MKLWIFNKHTDFGSIKQIGDRYEVSVRLPAGRYERGYKIWTEFRVPSGSFFENIIFESNLTSDQKISGNTLTLNIDGGTYRAAIAQVHQVASGVYRLLLTLNCEYVNNGFSDFPEIEVRAKVRLSLSVF